MTALRGRPRCPSGLLQPRCPRQQTGWAQCSPCGSPQNAAPAASRLPGVARPRPFSRAGRWACIPRIQGSSARGAGPGRPSAPSSSSDRSAASKALPRSSSCAGARRAASSLRQSRQRRKGAARVAGRRADSGSPLVVEPVTDTTMMVALGKIPSRLTCVMSCEPGRKPARGSLCRVPACAPRVPRARAGRPEGGARTISLAMAFSTRA